MNKPRKHAKIAMGPLCGQLALEVGNVPALRVHFPLLIANWQRYALTPLLIVIFYSLPFRVFRFCSRLNNGEDV
jgi:hypothetical protein